MKEKEAEVVVKGNKMYCKGCGGRIFLYEYGGRKEAHSDCTCEEEA